MRSELTGKWLYKKYFKLKALKKHSRNVEENKYKEGEKKEMLLARKLRLKLVGAHKVL